MKKLLLSLFVVVRIQSLLAQQNIVFNSSPYHKTISVSGSAEMEVIPDEIYVNITLREYQKKGDPKKDVETIKTAFLENCKSSNIPDSLISIQSFTGYNSYYAMKRKKNPDLYASITYQVKFRDSKTMDALVEKLDDEATQNFQIVGTSHSKMTEFRKALKIRAVQAAKDKAIYLTDAINEKVGEAIKIEEPAEPNVYVTNVSNVRSQAIVRSTNGYANFDSDKEAGIDFKKLKIRFEVEVVFALK